MNPSLQINLDFKRRRRQGQRNWRTIPRTSVVPRCFLPLQITRNDSRNNGQAAIILREVRLHFRQPCVSLPRDARELSRRVSPLLSEAKWSRKQRRSRSYGDFHGSSSNATAAIISGPGLFHFCDAPVNLLSAPRRNTTSRNSVELSYGFFTTLTPRAFLFHFE